MSYQKIDLTIRDWSDKYKLSVYTSYKDYEVRSVDVVDQKGRKYQIWIDPPDQRGNVEVHAWDYRRRRKDYIVSANDLRSCLEEAYNVVSLWIRSS
jgi:hypothetical protein